MKKLHTDSIFFPYQSELLIPFPVRSQLWLLVFTGESRNRAGVCTPGTSQCAVVFPATQPSTA